MRRWLRRFAAVGLVVTAVDLGLLMLLARRFGWPVIVADGAALSAAATVSFLLNRSLTFTDDPFVRWVEAPATFLVTAVLAGAVDIIVLQFLVSATALDDGGGLVGLKLVALGCALAVRVLAYRTVLFTVVRRDLDERVARPPAPGELRLSVVVPAYGEERHIAGALGELRSALAAVAADGGLELIVVDDGSVDGTAAAARSAGADQVIVQPRNRGKGAAVRAGVLSARGRTVAFTDADLAYPPAQLLSLLATVEQGWDVVVGSRKHTDTTTVVRARRVREIGGRLINVLTHAVLLGQYRDTQCGIKAFRSDVARLVFLNTHIDGFAFDVEVFHLVERYRLSLAEVPVQVANSSRSSVHVVRDALRLIRDLFRVRRGASKGWYDTPPEELATLRASTR